MASKSAPLKPGNARSAYMFFMKDWCKDFKQTHPDEAFPRNHLKIIPDEWKKMDERARAPYNELAYKDKIRKQEEIMSYVPVREPLPPRKSKSAFLFYCDDEGPKVRLHFQHLKRVSPDRIAKELASRWRILKADEKSRYEDLEVKDKVRFDQESKIYETQMALIRDAKMGPKEEWPEGWDPFEDGFGDDDEN